jgi:hypothetical protein
MREGWMQGKVNPATGEPLEIVYPAMPPGSMLSFVHHMPHGVTPVHAGIRMGILLTYRTADPNRYTSPCSASTQQRRPCLTNVLTDF